MRSTALVLGLWLAACTGRPALARSFPIGEVWWNGDRRESAVGTLEPLAGLIAKTVTASTARLRFHPGKPNNPLILIHLLINS